MTWYENINSEDILLLTNVAGLLGEKWAVSRDEDNSHRVILADTSRPGVEISGYHKGDRYQFSAYAGGPYYFGRGEKADGLGVQHEITVTDKGTSKSIAGHITRRLLPNYLASRELQFAAQERQDAYYALVETEVRGLADVAPGVARVESYRDEHPDTVRVPYDGDKVQGDFKFSTYGEPHYTIGLDYVPPEVARQILALIAASR